MSRQSDDQDLKMSALGSTNTGWTSVDADFEEDESDGDEEIDHLIRVNRSSYAPSRRRHRWGCLCRLFVAVSFIVSLLSIMGLIWKEWYLVSHEADLSTALADPDTPAFMCTSVNSDSRFDCFPGPGASAAECYNRGCC